MPRPRYRALFPQLSANQELTFPPIDVPPHELLNTCTLLSELWIEQISWGKLNRLPCTVAESTLRVLDGYGLRGKLPARPALTPCIRFLFIDSHVCSMLPSDPTSRRWPLH